MAGETIGVVTDPGSSLSPEAAAKKGVLLLDPERPFDEQYRRYLGFYDKLLSLHASPRLCPMYERAKSAAETIANQRVRAINTRLGSAGLGSAALRAASLLNGGKSEDEALAEVRRLADQGRFLLLSRDLRRLVENGLLPGFAGKIGAALRLWALISLENETFLTSPLPLAQGRVLQAVTAQLSKHFTTRAIAVRAVFGDVSADIHEGLKKELGKKLHLHSGTLAPMDAVARGRVGDHSLAVFAYPVG